MRRRGLTDSGKDTRCRREARSALGTLFAAGATVALERMHRATRTLEAGEPAKAEKRAKAKPKRAGSGSRSKS